MDIHLDSRRGPRRGVSLARRRPVALLAAALVVLTSLVSVAVSPESAQAADGDPFDPTVAMVFVGQDQPNTRLYSSLQGPGGTTFDPVGPASAYSYNALGFNTSDNYLYAIRRTDATGVGATAVSNHLLRIGQGGVTTDLGAVTGLPLQTSIIGSFGSGATANILYVRRDDANNLLHAVNVTTKTATTITLDATVPNTADFVYLSGYLWGLSGGTMYRINPTTGGVRSWSIGVTGTFGAMWVYGNGNIGMMDNSTGAITQLKVTAPAATTPTFTVVSVTAPTPSLVTTNNDGASTPGSPVDLAIAKSGPSTFTGGESITYTLTVTNNGPGASTGYVVTDPLPTAINSASSAAAGCSVVSRNVTCIGAPLAVGASRTITVTGTIAASTSGTLSNTATVTGNEIDPVASNNQSTTSAVAPLTCTDTTYALRENGTIVSWPNSSMDTLTMITPTTRITATGTITDANALGITPGGTAAHYYGLNGTTPTIYSWSAATNATTSRPAGITPTTSPVAGAVNPVNGNYYFGGVGAGQALYMFNPTTGITMQVGRAPSANASVNASLNGDIAFSAGGDLYYVSQQRLTVVAAIHVPSSTSTAQMPGTQLATSAPIVSVGISFDAAGSLMLLSQTTILQTVYKVNPLTGATIDAAFITLATGVDNTDLASCSSPGTLTLKKDVASRVNTGDQFTLNIAASGSSWTSTTTGAATGIQSVFAGPIPGVPGTSYTLSETAAGATDLAQYGSTYQCVDTAHGNAVISSGSTRSFTLTYPAANGQAIVCTFTNTPVGPSYTVQKSVSAGPVHQGDTVTYTVLVKNTGVIAYTTASPASFTDDLSAVLDDATYNNDATVGATFIGTTLSWSGALAVGETVTVTYSVKVKNPNTGNNSLVNVVTPTGTGGTCATGQVCTTTTPVLPPLGVQIQKVGEDSTGTVVPMDGSQWAIYSTATGGTALIGSVPAVAGNTGLFSATPLTAGTTYYLTETKALAGFQLLAQRVEFTLSSTGAITLAAGTSSNITVTTVNGAQTIRVEDVPAFRLPTTGGTGTTWIYLTGGGIILAALLVLGTMQLAKRRRGTQSVRAAHVRDDSTA